MSLKIVTYGGKLGWFLRKHFSKYTSEAYLNLQYVLRKGLYKEYIKYFLDQGKAPAPCLISIETINRCNNTCSFCPVNRNMDKRPFQKMTEELFHKIISELQEKNYDGYLNLYVNNEPFVDTRIEEWYRYAKEHLPRAKMLLYTNGLLLTRERFDKIVPYIDKMIINNYSENMQLHDNIKDLYQYIRSVPDYRNRDITIQIRYIHEILTNRAGDAPNKRKRKDIHWECIMPFTDITIFPSGIVGLCCSDALEKTNLGNVANEKLWDIWNSKMYLELRRVIGSDRSDYGVCKGCDFFDAGIRSMFIRERLKNYSSLDS